MDLEISKKNEKFYVKAGITSEPPISVQHTNFAFEDLVFSITAERDTIFEDIFIINDPVFYTKDYLNLYQSFTLKFQDDDVEGGSDTSNLECNNAGFFFHQGSDFCIFFN